MRQHHSFPSRRCRGKGQLGPSRHAYGHGQRGGCSLVRVSQSRPQRSPLAQPGPLHPLCGTRLALLYALLHLAGYPISLDELHQFRQWQSRTPGHPERGVTPGVETTTGPLGQGFANGVGMALAAQMQAARFNTPDFKAIDHWIYAIVSDGDLMEGISHEAASLAGHLGLGRLIYLYDDNAITIEGATDLAFSEQTALRFEGYSWHTLTIDGHDPAAIRQAILDAQAETDRPSLIICKTHIGYGSPNKQDTASCHGAPLGTEEVRLAKEKLGWPVEPVFHVPDAVRQAFEPAQKDGGSPAPHMGRGIRGLENPAS